MPVTTEEKETNTGPAFHWTAVMEYCTRLLDYINHWLTTWVSSLVHTWGGTISAHIIYTQASQTHSSCYPIQHATLGVLTLSQNVVNIDVYGYIKTLDIFHPPLPLINCSITPSLGTTDVHQHNKDMSEYTVTKTGLPILPFHSLEQDWWRAECIP